MTQIVTFTPNPAVDVSTSVERIVPVAKLRCSPQRRDPGGGGINVARVVKRFGGDVMAIFLYGGATGRLLQQLVKREEIPTLASEIAEETREDFSVYEESNGKQYRFVLPGLTLSDAEWRAGLDTLAAVNDHPAYLASRKRQPAPRRSERFLRAHRTDCEGMESEIRAGYVRPAPRRGVAGGRLSGQTQSARTVDPCW